MSAGTEGVSSEFPTPLLNRTACPPVALAASPMPPSFSHSFGEEPPEENRVHLGHAIMSFYAALIDLLGRCAPEMHVRTKDRGAGMALNLFMPAFNFGPELGNAGDTPVTKRALDLTLPELPVQWGKTRW